ncbi:MAG: hypothetical protein NW220_19225 [Leptolyngbyaceae cyanobacterium bins.349]|nr:hypothetical protein [Leptolyngbyaceae cyanobacterium bins.349]
MSGWVNESLLRLLLPHPEFSSSSRPYRMGFRWISLSHWRSRQKPLTTETYLQERAQQGDRASYTAMLGQRNRFEPSC